MGAAVPTSCERTPRILGAYGDYCRRETRQAWVAKQRLDSQYKEEGLKMAQAVVGSRTKGDKLAVS